MTDTLTVTLGDDTALLAEVRDVAARCRARAEMWSSIATAMLEHLAGEPAAEPPPYVPTPADPERNGGGVAGEGRSRAAPAAGAEAQHRQHRGRAQAHGPSSDV